MRHSSDFVIRDARPLLQIVPEENFATLVGSARQRFAPHSFPRFVDDRERSFHAVFRSVARAPPRSTPAMFRLLSVCSRAFLATGNRIQYRYLLFDSSKELSCCFRCALRRNSQSTTEAAKKRVNTHKRLEIAVKIDSRWNTYGRSPIFFLYLALFRRQSSDISSSNRITS